MRFFDVVLPLVDPVKRLLAKVAFVSFELDETKNVVLQILFGLKVTIAVLAVIWLPQVQSLVHPQSSRVVKAQPTPTMLTDKSFLLFL